jgi:hypothetical protein
MPDSSSLIFPELFEGSYPLPVPPGSEFPRLPRVGITRKEDVANPKTAVGIPWFVASAISTSVYAYTRRNTRRNLYRVHLP